MCVVFILHWSETNKYIVVLRCWIFNVSHKIRVVFAHTTILKAFRLLLKLYFLFALAELDSILVDTFFSSALCIAFHEWFKRWNVYLTSGSKIIYMFTTKNGYSVVCVKKIIGIWFSSPFEMDWEAWEIDLWCSKGAKKQRNTYIFLVKWQVLEIEINDNF